MFVMRRWAFALIGLNGIACARAQEPVEVREPRTAASTASLTPRAAPARSPPDSAAPTEEPVTPRESPSTGRMAFTQCPAGKRQQACTREYKPVCAEVDTGVRCI